MADPMNIVAVVGTIAAVIAAAASVKALYPRPRPTIERVDVSLAIHHANTRHNSISFLARNLGPRPYEIIDLSARCDSIDLPKYNLVAVNQWPGEGVGKNGAQKLPLTVEGFTSKQVFCKTEEVQTKYEGELPDSILLELKINTRPHVITKVLSRQDEGHHYR